MHQFGNISVIHRVLVVVVQVAFAIPAGALLGYLAEQASWAMNLYSVADSYWACWTAVLTAAISVVFYAVYRKWSHPSKI